MIPGPNSDFWAYVGIGVAVFLVLYMIFTVVYMTAVPEP